MKQNITQQDLLQLNEKQIKALFTYWWKSPPLRKNLNTPCARCEYDTGYLLDLPMLSIGDMIQYLQQLSLSLGMRLNPAWTNEWYVESHYSDSKQKELCDCLWKLTKEYLNQ